MTPERDEVRPVAPDEVHAYADGEIATRRGRVNRWLMVVYVVLTAWALYYLVRHWGGLGPGLGS